MMLRQLFMITLFFFVANSAPKTAVDCGDQTCALNCLHGFETNPDTGCEVCECVGEDDELIIDLSKIDDTTDCGDIMCDLHCLHGFEKHPETGCDMCKCTKEEDDMWMDIQISVQCDDNPIILGAGFEVSGCENTPLNGLCVIACSEGYTGTAIEVDCQAPNTWATSAGPICTADDEMPTNDAYIGSAYGSYGSYGGSVSGSNVNSGSDYEYDYYGYADIDHANDGEQCTFEKMIQYWMKNLAWFPECEAIISKYDATPEEFCACEQYMDFESMKKFDCDITFQDPTTGIMMTMNFYQTFTDEKWECDSSNNKPVLKACVGQKSTWNAGWGACNTYYAGSINYNYCHLDFSEGLYAKEVCPGCNACVQETDFQDEGKDSEIQSGNCDEGFQEIDGACFMYVNTNPLNFTDAESYCRDSHPGAHLATITSEAQNQGLAEMAEGHSENYIGLYLSEEGKMEWTSGAEIVYQDQWHDKLGEKNANEEYCTRLVGAEHKWKPEHWDNWQCYNKDNFFCSYSLVPVIQADNFHKECWTAFSCQDDGDSVCDACGQHNEQDMFCCRKDWTYEKGHNCYAADFSSELEHTCVTPAELVPFFKPTGPGGCGDSIKIGTADTLEEAKELMLSHDECSQEGSLLYYSSYSYHHTWGVRCAAPEIQVECEGEDNENWQEYLLSFDVDNYHSECWDDFGCKDNGETVCDACGKHFGQDMYCCRKDWAYQPGDNCFGADFFWQAQHACVTPAVTAETLPELSGGCEKFVFGTCDGDVVVETPFNGEYERTGSIHKGKPVYHHTTILMNLQMLHDGETWFFIDPMSGVFMFPVSSDENDGIPESADWTGIDIHGNIQDFNNVPSCCTTPAPVEVHYEYVMGEYDTQCGDDIELIQTKTECENALIFLEISKSKDWFGSRTNMPAGCSYRESDGRLHWNTNTLSLDVTAPRSDLAPICKQEIEHDNFHKLCWTSLGCQDDGKNVCTGCGQHEGQDMFCCRQDWTYAPGHNCYEANYGPKYGHRCVTPGETVEEEVESELGVTDQSPDAVRRALGNDQGEKTGDSGRRALGNDQGTTNGDGRRALGTEHGPTTGDSGRRALGNDQSTTNGDGRRALGNGQGTTNGDGRRALGIDQGTTNGDGRRALGTEHGPTTGDSGRRALGTDQGTTNGDGRRDLGTEHGATTGDSGRRALGTEYSPTTGDSDRRALGNDQGATNGDGRRALGTEHGPTTGDSGRRALGNDQGTTNGDSRRALRNDQGTQNGDGRRALGNDQGTQNGDGRRALRNDQGETNNEPTRRLLRSDHRRSLKGNRRL